SKFVGAELSGRTFGIVGFGKIGQALASRLAGLQMRVIASDPFLTAEVAERHGIELVELPELLAEADVISLHVPLTRSTRGLIGLDGRATAAAVNAPLASPEDASLLAPYLSLATILGQLLRLVTPGGVGEVVVELGGELAAHDGAPLVAGVLLGILEPGEERL